MPLPRELGGLSRIPLLRDLDRFSMPLIGALRRLSCLPLQMTYAGLHATTTGLTWDFLSTTAKGHIWVFILLLETLCELSVLHGWYQWVYLSLCIANLYCCISYLIEGIEKFHLHKHFIANQVIDYQLSIAIRSKQTILIILNL